MLMNYKKLKRRNSSRLHISEKYLLSCICLNVCGLNDVQHFKPNKRKTQWHMKKMYCPINPLEDMIRVKCYLQSAFVHLIPPPRESTLRLSSDEDD